MSVSIPAKSDGESHEISGNYGVVSAKNLVAQVEVRNVKKAGKIDKSIDIIMKMLIVILVALVLHGSAKHSVDLSDCDLPIVKGPCKAAIPSWAYKSGACVEFIYGGCEGNANNFQTQQECQQKCIKYRV